ncbi:ArsA family ATPase [Haliangium ochraceum]|nr:ArsA family ATPase [Haliangium ochraceum]
MASLLDSRIILIVGKGGVGRSTVAAAVAAATARRGRNTLLLESNANDRFGPFFGKPAVGTEIVRLAPQLHAVNSNPAAALEEYGMMVLRFRRVYKMVFENRVTRYFLRAIPGLDDYSILGKAWYHTTETERGRPKWDTVVFDMPASGHSLSMLRLPKVILDTVPEGPLTRDARTMRDLFLDPAKSSILLVTLAEEMPVNEARELTSALRDELGMRVSHLLVNQVYPERFAEDSAAAQVQSALASEAGLAPRDLGAPGPGADEARIAGVDEGAQSDLAALVAHSELARGRRRLNERYLEELARTLEVPQSELPLLFVPTLGRDQIDLLSKQLERQLER